MNHITYLQAARVQNGVLQKVTETDFAKLFKSILDKTSVLRRDPRIRFLMEEWTGSGSTLDEIIMQFVGSIPGAGGEQRDIRIIDISGLPNEVAGPVWREAHDRAAIDSTINFIKLKLSGKETALTSCVRRSSPICAGSG